MNSIENATDELSGVIGYSKEELEEFKVVLLEKLEKAKGSLEFHEGANFNENSTDDTGHSFETVENARETLSQNENGMLGERQDRLIKNIDLALTRIRLGTYGIDRITKKLISKERLLKAPLATMSLEVKIEDKKQKELAFIQKVKGGIRIF